MLLRDMLSGCLVCNGMFGVAFGWFECGLGGLWVFWGVSIDPLKERCHVLPISKDAPTHSDFAQIKSRVCT